MKIKTNDFLVKSHKIITGSALNEYKVAVGTWIVVNLFFWGWWLQPQNVGNVYLFSVMSWALMYEITILPSLYIFFLYQMRKPVPVSVTLAQNEKIVKKVAMITLTVPGSESMDIVKRQLEAITKVKYPHDSWLLVDKVHSPELKELAESLEVKYFCRHDVENWGQEKVARWNQPLPPFKAKTKAGNVNAWIDAYGAEYSHFTQLDIDHIPKPKYLEKVLGFFRDRKVAWVQAPSVYGNFEEWTAKGSAEQELVLQGALQMGFYGYSKTPFIIGSHCTYDMQAIKDIGGFQPTRAEDHLDTVFLAAAGRQGVFVPEVIAVGDGPENFETYMAQQFAWAYSMIQVLFNYTPKCIKNYTKRQALQFLFVQTWYTLWSTSMLLLFILPLVALLTNTSIANVNFWEFTERSLLISTTALVIWKWSHKWHFPEKVDLTWSGMVLHIARWPIVLSAFIQVLLKVEKPYMITVKGIQNGLQRPFNIKMHAPYFILIAITLLSCWYYIFTVGHSSVQGYLLFALEGGGVLLLVYITALLKDYNSLTKEGLSWVQNVKYRFKAYVFLLIIATAIISTTFQSATKISEAIFIEENHPVAQTDYAMTLLNPVINSESVATTKQDSPLFSEDGN